MITSLDDYSRLMLYAKLLEHESSWAHIESSASIILTYGCPYQYYIDCHSIFRYVKGRDQLHHNFTKFTDDVDPQWKQVILDCQIKPVYALSPQAKGKVERPCRIVLCAPVSVIMSKISTMLNASLTKSSSATIFSKFTQPPAKFLTSVFNELSIPANRSLDLLLFPNLSFFLKIFFALEPIAWLMVTGLSL